MKRLIITVYWVFAMSPVVHAAGPSAQDLLAASDRSRGAAATTEGLSWTAELETVENGEKSLVAYEIKVRGVDALARTLSPPRQKGEVILFNDRTLWFVRPGLKKPASISPRQRLIGQASNGDIASTQYARDYDGTIAGEEEVGGQAAWKLDLKGKAKNVTYDQIRYWISKKDKLGIKAEFLTVSGEPFKAAEFKYGATIVIKGQKLPFITEMVIRDAANADNVTVIKYKNAHESPNPPSLFNVNNLTR